MELHAVSVMMPLGPGDRCRSAGRRIMRSGGFRTGIAVRKGRGFDGKLWFHGAKAAGHVHGEEETHGPSALHMICCLCLVCRADTRAPFFRAR